MGENCSVIKQREENIPADEILVHLPARHLQILKSVSKDWLHLIASDYFVRLHLSKANRRIRVVFTLPYTKADRYDPDPPTMVDYYENSNTLVKIPYPPQLSKATTTIAGSADGLICLLDQTTQVIALLNPSTGKYFTSYLGAKKSWAFSWFGKYNNNNPNPNPVLVVGTRTWTRTRRRVEFEVYKIGRTNRNRNCIIQSVLVDRIANQPADVFPLDQRGTLVQGVVYWPTRQLNVPMPDRFKILAYHIDSNTYSEIPPPAPLQCEFRLGVGIAGLFATLKNSETFVFEVWVMKEYSSWTKYAKTDINALNISVLGFFPNGDMLLDVNKSKLIRYNFNHNHKIILKEYADGPINDAIICADTLVSP